MSASAQPDIGPPHRFVSPVACWYPLKTHELHADRPGPDVLPDHILVAVIPKSRDGITITNVTKVTLFYRLYAKSGRGLRENWGISEDAS